MKEWKCVEVEHYEAVSSTIETWQKRGWRLHTCETAGMGYPYKVKHCLLFEKGES